jgi:hypothetical protein
MQVLDSVDQEVSKRGGIGDPSGLSGAPDGCHDRQTRDKAIFGVVSGVVNNAAG